VDPPYLFEMDSLSATPGRAHGTPGSAFGTVEQVPTSPTPGGRSTATVSLSLWTLAVWATRINNICAEEGPSTAARAGRTALALSLTVLAVAALVGAVRRRRREVLWLAPLVRAFAAWTVAVWVVRAVQISLAGHRMGFVVVHLVLAVVSTVLALAAAREVGRLDRRRPESAPPGRREPATGRW
jgi:hypothetical protein